jgi:hypothetical protein
MRGFRLEHLLKRLLDENEFLSEYDFSLSKYHEKYPFIFKHDGHQIQYEPGESRSNMFEGTQTGVVHLDAII